MISMGSSGSSTKSDDEDLLAFGIDSKSESY